MPRHVLETTAINSLPEVGERLLTDDRFHLAIIRAAVPSELFHELVWATSEQEKQDVMNEMIPELTVLTGVVKSWWAEHGYIGTELEDPVNSKNIDANKYFTPHIDLPQAVRGGGPLHLFGGLTLSIGAGLQSDSYADYAAKKPAQPMSRVFNEDEYHRLGKQSSHTERFPAKTRQYNGDIALFTQHPAPAAHRVRSYNGRQASLIDFPISPVFPELQTSYSILLKTE